MRASSAISTTKQTSIFSYLKPKNLFLLALTIQASLLGIVEAHQMSSNVIPIGDLPFPIKVPVPVAPKSMRYGQCLFFRFPAKNVRVITGTRKDVLYDMSIQPNTAACVTGDIVFPHSPVKGAEFHFFKHSPPFITHETVDLKFRGSYIFVPANNFFSDQAGIFFVNNEGAISRLNIDKDSQEKLSKKMGGAKSKVFTDEEIIEFMPPHTVYEASIIQKLCHQRNQQFDDSKWDPAYMPYIRPDVIEIFERVVHWWKESEDAVQCKIVKMAEQPRNIAPPIAVAIPAAPVDPLLQPMDTYVITSLRKR